MAKLCIMCGKPLSGRRTKICSDECRRERENERVRKYYHANIEKGRKRGREWRRNNQEYPREYYQKNQDKLKERRREYRQNNIEKEKVWKRTRYRRSRGLPEDCDLFKESSIEVIMKRWLQESDIKFIEQYHINFEGATYTRVDFYIPEMNICLYVDGDYWHGPEMPNAQERDVRNNRVLEAMGYIIIRLSESEILAGIRPIEMLEMEGRPLDFLESPQPKYEQQSLEAIYLLSVCD